MHNLLNSIGPVLKVRLNHIDLTTFYEMVLSSKIRTNGIRSDSLYRIGICLPPRQLLAHNCRHVHCKQQQSSTVAPAVGAVPGYRRRDCARLLLLPLQVRYCRKSYSSSASSTIIKIVSFISGAFTFIT